MSEDAAFVRAIREQPDDETARLVYADWLDDRSDPRAEYLRAEAAWATLPTADEQSRPLFRRVSQLAATLDPEWFAAVSRLGHFARQAWERVALVWHPHPHERTTEPVREWLVAKQELENTFSRFAGSGATIRRFCVPADYLAFITTTGGGWHRRHEWYELYSASRAARTTDNLGDTFADEPAEQLEMWTAVAVRVTNTTSSCAAISQIRGSVRLLKAKTTTRGWTAPRRCTRSALRSSNSCAFTPAAPTNSAARFPLPTFYFPPAARYSSPRYD